MRWLVGLLLGVCLAAPIPAAIAQDHKEVQELFNVLRGLVTPPAERFGLQGYVRSSCAVCPAELAFLPPVAPHSCGNQPLWDAAEVQATLDKTRQLYEALAQSIKAADATAEPVLTSAYRSQMYQDHLYSIYKATQYEDDLDTTCESACTGKLRELRDECGCHGVCKNPVAQKSSHSDGQSFDIQMGTVGQLSDCALCDLAHELGLSVLIECRAYHFTHVGRPQCQKKCHGPYVALRCQKAMLVEQFAPLAGEEIPGDEGDEFKPPVWNFRLGEQSIATLFPSLLAIKKIILSQGLPRHLVAAELTDGPQEAVQVMGTTVVDGKTLYAFADPLEAPPGDEAALTGLTYTELPPPKAQTLTVTPATLTLQRGTTAPLAVTALLEDNRTLDVSSRLTWTIYRSSDAAVAAVDSNGLVTAVGAGMAEISVMNGQARAQVPVTVLAVP
jgi:hypothetical protein